MKTLSNKTKTLFKTSFLIVALIVGCTSCGGSDDVGDDGDDGGTDDLTSATIPSDLLVTYDGLIVFNDGNEETLTNGTATVSGSRGNYTITFSDGFPSLTNLDFIFEEGLYVVSDNNTDVVIDEDALVTETGELIIDADLGDDNLVFLGDR